MDQKSFGAAKDTSRPGDATPDANQTHSYELYSPQQVALAAFLGAPIAACWFIARNYRNLGNNQAGNVWLVSGLIGTVAILAICFYLPDGFPNQLIPISYTFGLLYAAKAVQGEAVTQHTAAGGRLGSWWTVAGVGLLCLIAILVIAFGIVLASSPMI
jgi:hypothetical protein